MNSTISRRYQRVTAWAMLLVWLFAVSAGVANACLLEERAHGSAAASIPVQASDHAAGTAHHATPEVTVGQHAPAEGKAACRKVCDESPQSPVKQASAADVDSPAPAVVGWRPWALAVMPAPDQGSRARRSHEPPPGPPPWVRYSRLAL